MQQALIQILLAVVPEVMKTINQLRGPNGEMPTDEQVMAKLQADVAGVLAQGEEWKAQHPNV